MEPRVRKSITIPGSLASAVKQRCREFGYASFTPYVVELVCYDLPSNAKHAITLAIANDTQAAQDAVDTELVARYRPGQQREGLLIQLVERIGHMRGVADRSRHDVLLPPLSAVAKRVTFPHDHLIERAEGRPVTDEELQKMKAQIAVFLSKADSLSFGETEGTSDVSR